MSDERIAQVLHAAQIAHGIPCPQAFAGAGVVTVSPAKPGGYCPSYRLRILGYRPGSFP